MPATSPDLLNYAREAGKQAVKLAKMDNMRPSDIVTMDSFENAILVHAAKGFNSVLKSFFSNVSVLVFLYFF